MGHTFAAKSGWLAARIKGMGQMLEEMKHIEADIINDLRELQDKMSQYTFIVTCGLDSLPDYPEQHKDDAHLIHECQVNTWVYIDWADGRLKLRAVSESLVINGALSFLIEIYDGRSAAEIQAFHCSMLDEPSFRIYFTHDQLNGLANIIKKF